jgi:hypothetical protein
MNKYSLILITPAFFNTAPNTTQTRRKYSLGIALIRMTILHKYSISNKNPNTEILKNLC